MLDLRNGGLNVSNGGWDLSNGGWDLSNGDWDLINGGWDLSNGGWDLSNGSWGNLLNSDVSYLAIGCSAFYQKNPSKPIRPHLWDMQPDDMDRKHGGGMQKLSV